MIEALITGRLNRDPETKISSKGNRYLMLLIRQDDETTVRCSLFGTQIDEFSKMRKGDPISVVGQLQASVWERSEGSVVSYSAIAYRAVSPMVKPPKKQTEPTAMEVAMRKAKVTA